jgi:hypothetical protein
MLLRYFIAVFALLVVQVSSSATVLAQRGACGGMTSGRLSSLNGFVPFAPESPWNTDISDAAVDVNSANIIDYIGGCLRRG